MKRKEKSSEKHKKKLSEACREILSGTLNGLRENEGLQERREALRTRARRYFRVAEAYGPHLSLLLFAAFFARPVILPQINVNIPKPAVLVVFGALFIFWFVRRPLEYPDSGLIRRAAARSLPFELYFLLQLPRLRGYYALTALLTLPLAVLPCVLLYMIYTRAKPQVRRLSPARKRRMLLRFAVPCAAAVMLAPAIAGLVTIRKPMAAPTVVVISGPAAELEERLQKELPALSKLEDSAWRRLDEQGRVDLLQTLLNLEASYLGIPETKLHCDESTGQGVAISHETLAANTQDSGFRCAELICHEARHRYQQEVLRSIDWKDKAVPRLRYYETARLWKVNYEDYIPKDSKGHVNQPVEKDADSYAAARVEIYRKQVEAYLLENMVE
ncbi:MAG: hypothetical protein FWH26_01510 [Oscillospiraceae bacterium]|nr:hypothetical protein [Oscillospiraceae bacterium]